MPRRQRLPGEQHWRIRNMKKNPKAGQRNPGYRSGNVAVFGGFGGIRDAEPDSEEAQKLAKKLQDYITEHFYNCMKEILSDHGKMYAGGGDFTKNIDSYGGVGTAEFAHHVIEIYCAVPLAE